MQNGIKKLYEKIQKLLEELIPDEWKEIYLYASILNGKNGEMYFYYYQKRLIKTNPISCYEIAYKFGIDEEKYNNALKKLYGYIKSLNNYMNPKWTNLTIVIKNSIFSVQYNYNDITHSKYTDEQRRIIWGYKYLHIPIDSMNAIDRALVESYKAEPALEPTVYSEPFYGSKRYNRELKQETKDKDSNEVKNQILKY